MAIKLDGPIPGQSLTTEPGNVPWEQPPQYADPEQVLAFYLSKFEDEEKLDDTMYLLEEGFPLSVLVDSMTTMGVMEGVHTLDAAILVKPVIHEYLKTLGENIGISVVESDEPTKEERDKQRLAQRLITKIASEGSQMQERLVDVPQAPEESQLPLQPPPQAPGGQVPGEQPQASSPPPSGAEGQPPAQGGGFVARR